MPKKTQSINAARFGLALVCESSRKWALASGAIMVTLSAFPVAIVYLHKLIVDFITEGISSGTEIVIGALLLLIAILTGLEIVYTFGQSVSRYVTEKQQWHSPEKVDSDLTDLRTLLV